MIFAVEKAFDIVLDALIEKSKEEIDDILQMKKSHPCGSKTFLVLRSGMDFKIRCTGCGHEVMVPRLKCEKNIKKILREEKPEEL